MYQGKDRKLNRWFGYDYSMPGHYFVTICTQNRISHFGEIVEGKMVLNEIGKIAEKQLHWVVNQYDYVKLDEYVIMPNHVHVIFEIINDVKIFGKNADVGNVLERSLRNADEAKILPLYRIVGAFKTTSSKLIHQQQNNFHFAWQKSFHDRVIREEKELNNRRYYIQQNPARWAEDRNNPINTNK